MEENKNNVLLAKLNGHVIALFTENETVKDILYFLDDIVNQDLILVPGKANEATEENLDEQVPIEQPVEEAIVTDK